MNFGEVVEALKAGNKVARIGWNAGGQWVVMMPSLYLDKGVVNARTTKHIGEGVDLDSQPYFVIWTAQKKWQPGWVPSTSDVLAEDWVNLNEQVKNAGDTINIAGEDIPVI